MLEESVAMQSADHGLLESDSGKISDTGRPVLSTPALAMSAIAAVRPATAPDIGG